MWVGSFSVNIAVSEGGRATLPRTRTSKSCSAHRRPNELFPHQSARACACACSVEDCEWRGPPSVQVRALEEAFLLVDENLLLASAQCISHGGGRVCVFVHTYVCARVCVRECTPKGVMLHVRHTHK